MTFEIGTPALIIKINSLLSTLSKSEQQVAKFIAEHPEDVIYLSVAALADSCGVSDPTVVRACQKLGYSGYQDLKIALTQSLGTPIASKNEDVLPEDGMQTIVSKVFRGSVNALQFTRDTLSIQDMETASEALLNAKRIYIFGLGGSSPIALDLQHKLMRLGMDACAYTDAHFQAMVSAYAGENDVLFAISHSGSSKGIVDNAKTAKNNGAKIISLTSMGTSPLTKLADISLYTASNETKYRIVALSSRIAELTIIDCLYTYLSNKSGKGSSMMVEKAMEAFKY